ncbi:Rpn family recombination-promoting nuclease/putative transposase [Desulfonatronospira thiodismutans]|nr:Rpn family recombination-promoting nuclease/putative transposase [Desulfonatronospira thiodismutans]
MHVIHGPHDKIFKRVMADRENAISLLKNILPDTRGYALAIDY